MEINKPIKNFIFIALILFTAILVVEKINGRFWLNDFKVFYEAAKALLANEKVYGIPFGLETGFYKYSPFTLLFFTPFTFVPYGIASVVDFIFISLAAISTIILLEKIVRKNFQTPSIPKTSTYLLILLCVVNHLVRELHLGNTNMILLFLLVFSVNLAMENKDKYASGLLAIAILTKPYFLICLLPYFLIKKYKTIIYVFAWLFIFVLVSGMIIGYEKSILLYGEWALAMKEHSTYLSSNHTLFSLLNYYFGLKISPSFGIVFLGIVGILSFSFLWMKSRNRQSDLNDLKKNNQNFILYYFILIAMIPSILVTDTEHFLFSLPLIVVLLLKVKEEMKVVNISLFIFLIFLYGGNSSDLLGKSLAGKFEDLGFLGIANILIIFLAIFLLLDKKSRWSEKSKRNIL